MRLKTVCNKELKISSTFNKQIIYNFNGGNITQDGGLPLIRQIDEKINVVESICNVIKDKRNPEKIEHPLINLVRQKLYQIVCGYEDDNDADKLRKDPIFKTVIDRLPESDQDLASQPTFCRLENSITKQDIFKLTEELARLYAKRKVRKGIPKKIIIDIDPTDDPTHGNQQYTLFHGYYYQYMYYPLIVLDGETGDIISALLRPGTFHASQGADGLLKRIIKILKEYFPKTNFIIRGDCGFGVPKMYNYCEDSLNNHNYIFGISSNDRLRALTKKYEEEVKKHYEKSKEKQKIFTSFLYKADSWEKERIIIAKVEYNSHDLNVRYLVTNMKFDSPEKGYDFYTKRGEAENCIRDLKNDLFLDRLSCHKYLANCFRMLMSCFAYVIMQEIRYMLEGTEFERAQSNTIRLKLLKIGVRIKETVRRIWLYFSSTFVYQDLYNTLLDSFG
jgi:hypothetical protein